MSCTRERPAHVSRYSGDEGQTSLDRTRGTRALWRQDKELGWDLHAVSGAS